MREHNLKLKLCLVCMRNSGNWWVLMFVTKTKYREIVQHNSAHSKAFIWEKWNSHIRNQCVKIYQKHNLYIAGKEFHLVSHPYMLWRNEGYWTSMEATQGGILAYHSWTETIKIDVSTRGRCCLTLIMLLISPRSILCHHIVLHFPLAFT